MGYSATEDRCREKMQHPVFLVNNVVYWIEGLTIRVALHMRPQLHKLPLIDDTSFLYKKMQCNYFDKPWHFHEEYELVLIEQSRGTKFIGDNVSLFQEGELILIGSNIPHLFRNNEEYYKKNGKLR